MLLVLDMLDVFIALNSLFLDLFHRIELSCSNVSHQANLAKTAATKDSKPLEVIQAELFLHHCIIVALKVRD